MEPSWTTFLNVHLRNNATLTWSRSSASYEDGRRSYWAILIADGLSVLSVHGTPAQLDILTSADMTRFVPLLEVVAGLEDALREVLLDALAESLGLSEDAMAGAYAAFLNAELAVSDG